MTQSRIAAPGVGVTGVGVTMLTATVIRRESIMSALRSLNNVLILVAAQAFVAVAVAIIRTITIQFSWVTPIMRRLVVSIMRRLVVTLTMVITALAIVPTWLIVGWVAAIVALLIIDLVILVLVVMLIPEAASVGIILTV